MLTPGSDTNEALRQRVAKSGSRPFHRQVVQSPWSTVRDVRGLHADIKRLILSTISGCRQQDAVRCLTIVGAAGYGKTHLLAWARQQIDQVHDSVFVYVSPYAPGSPGSPDPDQHVIRSVIASIMEQSQKQKGDFERAVREFLVRCHDQLIATGPRPRVKQILGVGNWVQWWSNRSGLRIGIRPEADQMKALRRVLGRRTFLQHAFAECQSTCFPRPAGITLDWDTFVAAVLLACGDSAQRWHAREWFSGGPTSSDILRQYHLDHPCRGGDKILNGLFTLQRLGSKSFCLAFDQLEDTFLALFQPGVGSVATEFARLFGTLIKNVCVIPGFCLLFACQQSVWQTFIPHTPAMLIDRMIEGHNAQRLLPLDEQSAGDLIRESMRVHVWNEIGLTPPDAEGLFPFTAEQIRQFRIQVNGEPRPFLQRAHNAFEEWLDGPAPPPPILVLDSVTPREVLAHEPTPLLLRGRHLPANVHVFFGSLLFPYQAICRPDVGEIDVTTPKDLVGDVEVRVQSIDDPTNQGRFVVRFNVVEPSSPYCESLDTAKFKKCREELKSRDSRFTQGYVAQQVGLNPAQVSLFERGRWAKAPENLYVQLAELYGLPLSAFLKDQ